MKSQDLLPFPELPELLRYGNDDVLFSFERQYDLPTHESREVFVEMLRYLWLVTKLRRDGCPEVIAIDAPLRVIDEMWHAFILHTAEYARFCMTYFGEVIHHQPTRRADLERFRESLARVPEADRAAWLRERKRVKYELVFDYLGETTFRKWYIDYAKRYDATALRTSRKR